MLKKIVSFVTATVMTLLIATSAAFSQENPIFFRQAVGNWVVLGHKGDDTIRPACVIGREWKDSSNFQLIFDLSDGEFYIRIENMEWEIGDEVGRYGEKPGTNPAKFLFSKSDDINGFVLNYDLHSKNLILYRHINVNVFMDHFAQSSELKIVMPGTIQNVKISLKDSNSASELVSSCLDVARKTKLNGPKTDSPVKKEQGT